MEDTSSNALKDPSPAPKYRLIIPSATPGHRYDASEFLRMSTRQRKSAISGHTVVMYIDQANSSPILYRKNKFPLQGLCAISPVVNSAIIQMRLPQSQIKDIALPEGNMEAYHLVLTYISTVLASGIVRPMPIEYETPLFKYYHVLEIANNLQITPLMENIDRRYNKMITLGGDCSWTLDPNDICKIYQKLDKDHPLRVIMVKNIALAWLNNGLSSRKCREVENVSWEYTEFWDELEEEMNTLWEGEYGTNETQSTSI